jgi:2-polyprenyl-6-methoxyphenol hydroxylase-like FAD-dependent oxidoreductase
MSSPTDFAIKTDVIIIGAGLTGLSLACQLTRYGIDFVIIEQGERVTPYSKAIGVHDRTIEIYEQLGLAQPAIEQGAIAGIVRLLVGGTVRGELNLSDIGAGMSPYPYLLILEQSKNEKLLYDYLQSHQKTVLWQTELQSFLQ